MWKTFRKEFLICMDGLREKFRVLDYWFLGFVYWCVNWIVYFWLRFIIVQTNTVRYLQELKKNIRNKRDNLYPDNQSLTGIMMKNDNT